MFKYIHILICAREESSHQWSLTAGLNCVWHFSLPATRWMQSSPGSAKTSIWCCLHVSYLWKESGVINEWCTNHMQSIIKSTVFDRTEIIATVDYTVTVVLSILSRELVTCLPLFSARLALCVTPIMLIITTALWQKSQGTLKQS